jgi:phage gp37-like protein
MIEHGHINILVLIVAYAGFFTDSAGKACRSKIRDTHEDFLPGSLTHKGSFDTSSCRDVDKPQAFDRSFPGRYSDHDKHHTIKLPVASRWATYTAR